MNLDQFFGFGLDLLPLYLSQLILKQKEEGKWTENVAD